MSSEQHRRLPAPTTRRPPRILRNALCESVEKIIRKRRLLFAGGVQRPKNERLTRRVMLETVVGGGNSGPYWLAGDLDSFRENKGSTESSPLLFREETALWPTTAMEGCPYTATRVASDNGGWSKQDHVMERWQRDEAERSSSNHAAQDDKSGGKDNTGGGEGGRQAVLMPLSTKQNINKTDGRWCGTGQLRLSKGR